MKFHFLILLFVLSLPAVAQEDASSSAPAGSTEEDALSKNLQNEVMKLQAMQAELQALEKAPLEIPKTAETPKIERPPVVIPNLPVKGLEAAYADSVYQLGKFEEAKAAYQAILKQAANPETLAWAQLQIGHCDRKTGDIAAAISSFEKVINSQQQNEWTVQAEWWASHLKWRLIWNATLKNNPPK